jgi:hypothetical protein
MRAYPAVGGNRFQSETGIFAPEFRGAASILIIPAGVLGGIKERVCTGGVCLQALHPF